MRRLMFAAVTAVLVTAACSTTPEDEESTTETSAAVEETTAAETTEAAVDDTTEETTAAPDTTEADAGGDTTAAPETPDVEPIVDDRAPGVTDTSVKVGVTYPDLTNVGPLLGIDQGSFEAAYTAVANAINAAGGVNGRTLELVFAPIDPPVADAGPAACTRLTQDEQVFVTVGFVQGADVLCYLDTNEALFVGGNITSELLAQAKVPWYSIEAGEDAATDGLRTLIDDGVVLDRLAVIGVTGDEALYEDRIAPVLDEAGIEGQPVYIDVAAGDANAIYANAETIAQRLEAEGFEQVMFIGGGAGAFFPTGLARTQYRPQILYLDAPGAATYAGGEGNDLSIIQDAIAVGPYDFTNDYATAGGDTDECIAALEAGGHSPIRPLNEVPDGEPDLVVSGMQACRFLYLLKAVLEAAGPELNYGTFATAFNSLEVVLPGSPDPLTFGPPPSTDGDLPQYVLRYDPATNTYVAQDG